MGCLLEPEDGRLVELAHDRVLTWVLVLALLNPRVQLIQSYDGQAISSPSELS